MIAKKWSHLLIAFCVMLISVMGVSFVQADIETVTFSSEPIEGYSRYSSAALADLNGDNRAEILVGTEGSYLVAMEYTTGGNYELLWETYLGASIGSSPAVGDVDGDGDLEVALGVGWDPESEPGNITLLDHNGNILWRVTTGDRNGGPDGTPDGVFSTPALGDLNNDGDLEIVVAGFDEELYALDYQGQHLPGWPKWLEDNSWGSPSLADLNHDGYLDVIAGSYANLHATDCNDYSCGRLFVYDYTGASLPGWPILVDTHLDSSPAVSDLDNDGELEIVIGSGRNDDPRFHLVYAFEANGQAMAGWPKSTGGFVWSSPAVADVDGDGDQEIFVGASDGLMYGWHHTGQALANWPVTPLNQNGQTQLIASSPTIIDADGDGQLEIFIPTGWDIVGFEVNGSPMSESYRLHTNYSIGSTPAWGDIDNDGKLEATVASGHWEEVPDGIGRINVWDMDSAYNADLAPWPMWRRDSERIGRTAGPPVLSSPSTFLFNMHQEGDPDNAVLSFWIENAGDGEFDWSATDNSSRMTLSPQSGTVGAEPQIVYVNVTTTGLGEGTHDIGTITLNATMDGDPIQGSPWMIPVSLYVGDISFNHLPIAIHQ